MEKVKHAAEAPPKEIRAAAPESVRAAQGEAALLEFIAKILQGEQQARINLATLPREQHALAAALAELAARLEEQRRHLEAGAYRDSLTGAENRLAFEARARKFWEERRPCTVAFIDIDNLKYCNDHSGHSEGDYYIKSVCNLLQKILREGEHLYRMGGDEFVILSAAADENDLEARLERAHAEYLQKMLRAAQHARGFSYGCARIAEATADAYDNILAAAEQKMYEFKARRKRGGYEEEERLAKNTADDEFYGLRTNLFDALSLLMSNGHYLYACNLRSKRSRWSKNAVRDFGMPTEFMADAGAWWLERIHPEDREIYLDGIAPVFNGQALLCELKFRVKDAQGNYITLTGTGYRLRGREGEPDLFVSSMDSRGASARHEAADLQHDYAFLAQMKRGLLHDYEGFYLVYQPQVDCLGRIVGVEALLRWRSIAYGVVYPKEFLFQLEKEPEFYDLGLWILRQALTDGLGILQDNPAFSVSVNISRKQLEREKFPQDVLRVLAQTGFPAENLLLELPKRCHAAENARLERIVNFFSAHKIRVATDAFASVYAALSHLRNVHFHTIKIDHNFMRGILDNSADRAIVNAIIECAHKLDTKVCVEGVENRDLLDFTRTLHAEYYQGFIFAKPLELNALKLLLKHQQQ